MSLPSLRFARHLALAAVLLVLGLTVGGGTAAFASAPTPRASLTDIENDVMCVVCRESLAVAQSPQAYQERQYIRTLIAQGMTKKQIEHDLVQQYGPAVLALPPAQGFNLLVYVIPAAVVLLGVGVVALTLPRWRRSSRRQAQQAPAAAASPLDPADARRLEEDLGRFA